MVRRHEVRTSSSPTPDPSATARPPPPWPRAAEDGRIRVAVDGRARRRALGLRVGVPLRPVRARCPAARSSPSPTRSIWLSYVAGATTTIRLATGILILPQRNPVVLAKEVATLDHLSGGRVELGIGVGWLEEEFDAIGVPFDERGKRTDDHVAAMRALWTERQGHLPRRVHRLRRLHLAPPPGQRVGADPRRRPHRHRRPPGRSPRRRLLPRQGLHRGARPALRRRPRHRQASTAATPTPSSSPPAGPRSAAARSTPSRRSPTSASTGSSCRRSCSGTTPPTSLARYGDEVIGQFG